MIDIKDLRERPDAYTASLLARGEGGLTTVPELLKADEERREATTSFEQLRAQQKLRSAEAPVAMREFDEEHRTAFQKELKELSVKVKEAKAVADAADERLKGLLLAMPNLVHPEVRAGGEEDFALVKEVGAPRIETPVVTPGHEVIAERLGLISTEAGAKVAGARSYYLMGMGARLSHALMALAQQVALEEGFTPLVVPNLVRREVMEGTGFMGSHSDEVYHLSIDELYLTGTSEVGLAGFHSGEAIDLTGGPLRYTATSTCYRREAGSYGKDSKGVFRVHQFQKTEMFVYCLPEQAEEEHANLLRVEERVLQLLELPYRVIDVAAGDLGASAYRKFDCEAWIPSQQRYRELTSTSNCTTFQSRRLGVRGVVNGEKTGPVATLNGTLLTDTRPIVALLENGWREDGSVLLPEVLWPFLGVERLEG